MSYKGSIGAVLMGFGLVALAAIPSACVLALFTAVALVALALPRLLSRLLPITTGRQSIDGNVTAPGADPRLSVNMQQNDAWWRANRPRATPMTRDKWFVIDGGALCAGPCASLDDAMQLIQELGCAPGAVIKQLCD